MPALTLRALTSLFAGVLLLGGLVILATGASVAYFGPLISFSVAAVGTLALLGGRGS